MPLHSLGDRFQEELELSLTYPDEIRADVEVAAVEALLGADGRFPADPGRVFRDTHDDLDFDTASRIIEVVLPPALRSSLLDEVEALVGVQARIQAQHPRDEQIFYGSYTDFSINLFSAPLFCRGLGEFIRANREVIDTEVMPDNFYVLAEFFRTEPGRSAWVHTAASTLVSSFPVARHSNVMNLHATLTDNTTVEAGPFLVWEDADSAVMSARYAYNYLVERGVVDEGNRDRFLRAVRMAESPNRADQGRGTRLLCRQFWHEYYTRDLERPVRGMYALYDPGQALVFSPNKPHGGELLSREVPGRARTSINLRATRSGFGDVLGHYARQMLTPTRWSSVLAQGRQVRTYRQLNTAIWEFYAVFFGYRDVGELFDVVFEGATPRLLHGVPISLRGQRGLVSLDGLFRHYDRCAGFFETHEIRDDALAFVRAANTRALHP